MFKLAAEKFKALKTELSAWEKRMKQHASEQKDPNYIALEFLTLVLRRKDYLHTRSQADQLHKECNEITELNETSKKSNLQRTIARSNDATDFVTMVSMLNFGVLENEVFEDFCVKQ